MKARNSGTTIGVALEPLSGSSPSPSKILVFVNLGYTHLDDGAAQLAAGATGPTNAWSVDQVSGKVNVNFFGDVSLNGNALVGVSQIVSQNGLWRISENGSMTMKFIDAEEVRARKVRAKELELEDEESGETYCVRVRSGTLSATAGACGVTASSAGSGIPPPGAPSEPPPASESASTTPPATSPDPNATLNPLAPTVPAELSKPPAEPEPDPAETSDATAQSPVTQTEAAASAPEPTE
jgi:hypothetical protein